MEEILREYKKLKLQLTSNFGCEDDINEVSWNDSIHASMEELLEHVPKDIANYIRLGYL